jgi:hypothetical protein
MAEVPEHLLKRAAERRAALEAQKKAEAGGTPDAGGTAGADAPSGGDTSPSGDMTAEEVAASNAEAEKTGKIPAHLLARSAGRVAVLPPLPLRRPPRARSRRQLG